MKVLEKGNINTWEKELICTGAGHGNAGCEARLLVSEKDIKLSYSTKCFGIFEKIDFYFKCPECNCLTDIAKDCIPTKLQNRLLQKGKYNSRYDEW